MKRMKKPGLFEKWSAAGNAILVVTDQRRNNMQTIQLQANQNPGFNFPQTLELQESPAPAVDDKLDEALAIVLQAVRQSKNPKGMDALGTLLAYMEKLEKKQVRIPSCDAFVSVTNPLTLSL
jgi:hypothetical protein